MTMSDVVLVGASLLAFVLGVALGALLIVLWRSRREQTLRIELEVLRARVNSEASQSAEREQALTRTREQLQAAFGELAQKTLQSNSEVFLQLARERLDRQQQRASSDLRERETAIETLVAPIRDALAKSEAQIQSIERDRIDAFATLKTQMELLSTTQSLLSRETRNLVTALRRPDVRGRWGELTLRRVVELSGMTKHVDFTEQHHQSGDGGAVRPDMIVHLPERRDIVVDVKTPLDAYLAAVEAQDGEERKTQLRRHAQIVATRVRELAGKQYWAQFERSPEYVVMFLPGDQFLAAALEELPELFDDSLRQNIVIATPSSLAALLKSLAYGWKQAVLADNATEVRKLGEELYQRLAVFGEHLTKLGKSLGASIEHFNKAVGSLEQQVLPAARRFPELGLRVDREVEATEPITNLARIPRASAERASVEPNLKE
jgi:DNA recombination protein RmuC